MAGLSRRDERAGRRAWRYERQGYIRPLERYAAELGELRGRNREPRT
ncbi:MAG: hypothetical protein U0Q11_25110 [Vicinamibacterales bacterium]